MMIRKLAAVAALATGLALGLAGAVGAQELKIGLKTEPSSLDPYYHNLGPNLQMSAHLFDQLVAQDDNQKLTPALATSWKPISDTEWEFNLRKGVKFSDGSDFTAEDVVFSVDRVAKVPNSPSPFTIYTKPIKEIKIIDPYKIVIVTNFPHPLLPNDLGSIYIMSKKAASGAAAEGKTTEQLNKGEGLVGTGPYKFVEWVRACTPAVHPDGARCFSANAAATSARSRSRSRSTSTSEFAAHRQGSSSFRGTRT